MPRFAFDHGGSANDGSQVQNWAASNARVEAVRPVGRDIRGCATDAGRERSIPVPDQVGYGWARACSFGERAIVAPARLITEDPPFPRDTSAHHPADFES